MELEELIKKCESLHGEEFEEFYRREVFPWVVEGFRKKCEKLKGKYQGLLLTVGFSPEPLILSITGLRPERVHFLCTRESEKHLDRIIEETGLRASSYTRDVVERKNGEDVYQCVRRRWSEWGFPRGSVAVDITGGTKAMVGGCATAASFLGLDLLYIDSEYGWKHRKSLPGSERPVILKNPFEVFGDLEERDALTFFRTHNYQAAQKIYASLAEKAPNPRPFEAKMKLAMALHHWDSFEYKKAYKQIKNVEDDRKKFSLSLPELRLGALEVLSKLDGDSNFTEFIKQPDHASMLAADLLANSRRRAEQGRYDDAILRVYRVLELTSQHLLLCRHDIDTGNVKSPGEDVEARFREASKEIYGDRGARGIADKLGLVDGWLLLHVLGDIPMEKVKEINERVSVRNNLMIEHRSGHGTDKGYNKFYSFTSRDIAGKFLPGLDRNLEQVRGMFRLDL